jgi:hypothetical protein
MKDQLKGLLEEAGASKVAAALDDEDDETKEALRGMFAMPGTAEHAARTAAGVKIGRGYTGKPPTGPTAQQRYVDRGGGGGFGPGGGGKVKAAGSYYNSLQRQKSLQAQARRRAENAQRRMMKRRQQGNQPQVMNQASAPNVQGQAPGTHMPAGRLNPDQRNTMMAQVQGSSPTDPVNLMALRRDDELQREQDSDRMLGRLFAAAGLA